MIYKFFAFLVLVFLLFNCSEKTLKDQNCDESDVKPYKLPGLLNLENGENVSSISEWEKKRRPEIIGLYENEIYGQVPEVVTSNFTTSVIEQSNNALDNHAIRKQVVLEFKVNDKTLKVNVLLYLPKETENPPVFIGYNFYGNQTVIDDPNIVLTDSWILNNTDLGVVNNRANEASRGKRNERWPIKKLVSEGFGFATVNYADFDPDKFDFSDGIQSLYYHREQSRPKSNEWGSISVWAWGYSRVLDYLKQNELTSNSKFIVFGHSRIGKSALWAGALDERFDMVIANNSGCAGAAIFRRKFGERISKIYYNFPQWFSENFSKYHKDENLLPIDQHMLIALIAPRPVYIASAERDCFSDPKGEFLSGFYATPVYELYGKKGLTDSVQPAVNTPVFNTIGYHVRSGVHGVTEYDWNQFIKFSKINLELPE